MDDSLIWLDGGRFGHVGPWRDGGAAMKPTLKETAMAAFGLVLVALAYGPILVTGCAIIGFAMGGLQAIGAWPHG
jgi:hypothetical protein